MKKFLFFALALVLCATSCEKQQDIPSVITGAATVNTSAKSAVVEGYVEKAGGSPVTDKGICYVRGEGTPSLSDHHVSAGEGTGSFSCTLKDLQADTYNYCAYAVNASGTSYGKVRTFNACTGEQGGGGSALPTSYLLYNDSVIPISSAQCTCYYYPTSTSSVGSYTARYVGFWKEDGRNGFAFMSYAIGYSSTLPYGTYTYSSNWDNWSPMSYGEISLLTEQLHSQVMKSLVISSKNGGYVVDAVIDSKSSMHYEGMITFSYR